jgi:hypothetical protein
MNSVFSTLTAARPVFSSGQAAQEEWRLLVGAANFVPNTSQRMQLALQASGGVVTGDAFSALLRQHCDQPLSLLARWIVSREIVSFELDSQRWLPMFQFVRPLMTVHSGVSRVIDELNGVFDELELAEWFATPNSWLEGILPAMLIRTNTDEVLAAARADRFVAIG